MSDTTTTRGPGLPPAAAELIRRRIAELRAATGLSPEALSRAAGLNHLAVRQYESGYRAPTLAGLYALAAALGCQIGDFLRERGAKRIPRKSRNSA